MKVVILGQNGMLGHVVKRAFENEGLYEVVGFGRESLNVYPRKLNDIGAKLSTLMGFETDYVINCIGAIKPTFQTAKDPSIPIYTNAVFPHQLATWGELTNTNIIHITTDCVFSGLLGKYTEKSPHDAMDDYGKSKSLGEPANSMVLRTSIFGPEQGGRKRSFLEWIKSQDGQEAKGFTNHYWNGLTTLELANCLLDIVDHDIYTRGLFHVFSEDVTKYDMVKTIARAYDLDIHLEEFETEICVDRTLRTVEKLNEFLQPNAFSNMVYDLVDFERKYSEGVV
jgi:dTDP-4-dehydrorhamnose reductase